MRHESANTTTSPEPRAPAPAAGIRCAEVWGGNRGIHTPVVLPGLRGVLYSRPCSGGRGGDIHYLSTCGSGLLSRICLADVAGHGDCVSKVGRQAHELLRRHVNWPDHRRLLEQLNVSLQRQGLHALTTAAVLTYYPPSRRLSFSYAGHPPAWHYSARRDAWRRLTLDEARSGRRKDAFMNGPLAVQPDTVFSRSRLRADEGDRLLLVTDGVLEAHDGSHQHFGVDGMERFLGEHRSEDLGEVCEALLGALAARCGTPDFRHDDVSFVLLEFVAPPQGPALWHVIRNRLLRPLGVVGGVASSG